MSGANKTCTIAVDVNLNKDETGKLSVEGATLQDNEAIKKCMETGDGENKGPEVKPEDTKAKKKAPESEVRPGDQKGSIQGGKRRRKSRGRKGGRKSKRRSSKKARKSRKSKRRRGKKSKRRRRRK